ncbi:alpha-glucosidase, partial [Pseudoalteromonas sp. SIMBA_162]
MPWRQTARGDFSNVEPWLPVDERHLPLAVANQEDDANSVLHATRTLLNFRRQHPVLREGNIELVDVGDE